MKWIPYDRQELEEGKDYLVCTQEEVNIVIFTKASNWKFIGVTAYMELPKPYEKPKTLKERLDEAVKKYCYSFDDEEWEDKRINKCYIYFNYKDKRFCISCDNNNNYFITYLFKTGKQARNFINSFTTEELLQIMKGEIR